MLPKVVHFPDQKVFNGCLSGCNVGISGGEEGWPDENIGDESEKQQG